MLNWIKNHFNTLCDLQLNTQTTDRNGKSITLQDGFQRYVQCIKAIRATNNKIMIIGNGGSAGIASHMAIDYSKNGHLHAMTFTDASAITCISNDYGYEHVFAKQIEYHARKGDVLIAISSSGKSANILKAVAAARAIGCHVITFSGFEANNPLSQLGDINYYVASKEYGFVEVAHLSLGHAMLDYIIQEGKPVMNNQFKRILVTGGAGYVGSRLIPKLLDQGYQVNVLDLYIYGKNVFGQYHSNPALTEIQGDIRDPETVRRAMTGCDAVIHLACISNDPSFDLNPELGKSINRDAFRPMVKIAKELHVKRFIYASSSSVYGIKDEPNVTEELSLNPLTDYSKYKAECEHILKEEAAPGFETLIVRPSTVCGYSSRLRLDLTVNILTTHAYYNKKIKVFGGKQLRPNIHIEDMCDAYLCFLAASKEQIDGKTFNVGYQNLAVEDIAKMVKQTFSEDIAIEVVPTDDNRSYHVSSDKIKRELGFTPKYTVENAINDLKVAFQKGLVQDPFTNETYYNIKQMQQIGLN